MAKQGRAQRTRELVLDSAAIEFAAHGFAGTNLQYVAERTGLTKGALYGHFASKALLAAELTDQFQQSWNDILGPAHTHTGSPMSALRRLALTLTERHDIDMRFQAGLRLATEDARNSGGRSAQLDDLHELILSLMKDAQRLGEVPPRHSPETLSCIALAMLFGIQQLTALVKTDDLLERIRTMCEVLIPTGKDI
ncbi:TetR family transcriptional regulator [Streptomyces sp. DT24]|uniref:TetR family transcriptional regulator n=1 Tax=unclassified Streptomyces TaxID=2593676 RepID=UPI003CF2D81A